MRLSQNIFLLATCTKFFSNIKFLSPLVGLRALKIYIYNQNPCKACWIIQLYPFFFRGLLLNYFLNAIWIENLKYNNNY